ncbi:hypothetical protein NEHOM01_1417 [Nematocida homosporus]|uniref:uncharacterized protein n=1 Tax=Nematocida homosporus TaxID=1912981 RepID=UPI0022211675|nr:uncharacterized protein NEHOM01_1417 [Nematocida homosporus]KAI5186363.1 hypothetical protein NEHOM01_1417 [Nematocida homosporus]
MEYTAKPIGMQYTDKHAVYIMRDSAIISPFHDIPIDLDEEKHMVTAITEIPRFSNAKLEIHKQTSYNPIKQDLDKQGQPRFVQNLFPKKGYLWNYGAIPQTWESTEVKDSTTDYLGDNDPIDVIEIGEAVLATGTVYRAKILGALAMIDGGECDWKVIVIREGDPLFASLNGLADIEKYLPGFLGATREWFRDYKLPAGSPPNEFALNGEYLDAAKAVSIVKETHVHWQGLIKEAKHEGISLLNRTITGTPGYTKDEFTPDNLEFVPATTEPLSAQKFYYPME